jgi:hypothetical protein
MIPDKYKQNLLDYPDALALAEKIWEAAEEVLGRPPATGGCTPFYTVQEWTSRGEDYGTKSMLIICHDGGDFAYLLNYDNGAYDLIDEFIEAMDEIGLWTEGCTCWYSAVYPGKEEEYKKEYICQHCGSTELYKLDVGASWDVESQEWKVQGVDEHSKLDCGSCDRETILVERITPTKKD